MGLETATYISELVTTNPVASDNKSQGDDHLRLIKAALQATFPGADLAFYLSADRADVASASSVDLGAVQSQYANITGTTTITSFGTCNAGTWRLIRFNAALTLTHNGTSLILPTAANITTVAGDHAMAFSRGSGNWTVLAYLRASGEALVNSAASTTASGIVELATAAEVVTGTDAARVPSVSVVKNHEGVSKAWGYCNSSGVIQDSYGVTSVVRASQGNFDVTLSGTMANALYAVTATAAGSGNMIGASIESKTTTTFRVRVQQASNQADVDAAFSFVVHGTLA